jgi:hypothetical protein
MTPTPIPTPMTNVQTVAVSPPSSVQVIQEKKDLHRFNTNQLQKLREIGEKTMNLPTADMVTSLATEFGVSRKKITSYFAQRRWQGGKKVGPRPLPLLAENTEAEPEAKKIKVETTNKDDITSDIPLIVSLDALMEEAVHLSQEDLSKLIHFAVSLKTKSNLIPKMKEDPPKPIPTDNNSNNNNNTLNIKSNSTTITNTQPNHTSENHQLNINNNNNNINSNNISNEAIKSND